VLQDGTAMVGRILFSWRYAPRLDRDVKTWRLAADVFNDLGMLLCLLSPVFTMPEMTLLSMCVGSLFKALCGVSGAATKGSLTVHFAKSNNLADVSAKDGSQETIVNLVGMISGTYLVTAVDGIAIPFLSYQIPVAWLLFTLLTVLHLYCNYQAVKSVVLDTLNDQRYALLCQRYITSGDNKRRCLTPAEIAARYETIFWWHFAPERPLIVLGASLSDFSEGKLRKSNGDYVLQSTVSQGCCVPRRHIYIGLLAADDRTILRALFHAHWLTCGLNKRTVSSQQINQEFSQFLKSLRDNGWQLSGCCQFSDKGSRLAVVKND
jgi:hypothetical protein